MATKATHFGTCQVCGHFQKLPGGNLSKHGYTVRWGFFEGTCTGSHHLPFEQSIHLILDAIERAKNEGIRLRKQATVETEQADPAKAIFREYVPARFAGRSKVPSFYRWVRVALTLNADGRVVFELNGKTHELLRESSIITSDLQKAAEVLGKRYADHLNDLAEQTDAYIKWQRERIEDWAPKPLTPVKGEGAPVKKETTRTAGARVLAYVGGTVRHREATVVSSRRDYFTYVTVKFDDGSYREFKQSYLTLKSAVK